MNNSRPSSVIDFNLYTRNLFHFHYPSTPHIHSPSPSTLTTTILDYIPQILSSVELDQLKSIELNLLTQLILQDLKEDSKKGKDTDFMLIAYLIRKNFNLYFLKVRGGRGGLLVKLREKWKQWKLARGVSKSKV